MRSASSRAAASKAMPSRFFHAQRIDLEALTIAPLPFDLDAADAQDKLDAAVAKVLEAVPELRGGAGTGSTGNFARRSGNAEDALDAKIRENIMGAC